MPDSITLSLTVARPILDGPVVALPTDQVAFTRSGRAFVIREVPPNYGRWLGHFTDGACDCRSHSHEETLRELVRLAEQPPRPPAAGAPGRRWFRRRA